LDAGFFEPALEAGLAEALETGLAEALDEGLAAAFDAGLAAAAFTYNKKGVPQIKQDQHPCPYRTDCQGSQR
jgi:hypothetical protein